MAGAMDHADERLERRDEGRHWDRWFVSKPCSGLVPREKGFVKLQAIEREELVGQSTR